MTKEQFIKQIAPLIQKYAPNYNIKVCSPIIAQAVLESDGGNSELAVNANNYFGLKYRAGRCPSSFGIYYKVGSEQNADGSYTSSAMQWCKFATMELGVKGYFEFTNISTYSNLKGVSDPETYLKNIKSDGYATSINYVQNLMNVIKTYNLTQYDTKGSVSVMSKAISTGYLSDTINGIPINSSVKCNSGNYENETSRNVSYIVIHYTGNDKDTALNNAKYFQTSGRKASAHFFIDDSSIYQSVELRDIAWHCGGSPRYHDSCLNTNSIGIEMCCSGNYIVSEKTKENAIYLCAHLCKLLGITASTLDTYVLRHYDCTHKKCPRQMAGASNTEWTTFKNSVKKILNGGTVTSNTTTTTTSSAVSGISIPVMNITKGNAMQFAQIVMNIKLALNADYKLSFPLTATVDNILLTNLSNVVLSSASYKPNITYALQQLLKWWGYSLTIDGIFGNGTKTVITTFQKQVGITATGTTTKEFWNKVLGK